MRKWTGGVLATTVLIVGASQLWTCFLPFNSADGSPRCVVRPLILEFGSASPSMVLKKSILIKNPGDKRLIVREVQGDCASCSGDSSLHCIVLPGSTYELPLELQTALVSGSVNQTRLFLTNDPQRPQFSVTIRANVQTEASP